MTAQLRFSSKNPATAARRLAHYRRCFIPMQECTVSVHVWKRKFKAHILVVCDDNSSFPDGRKLTELI